MRTFTGVVKHGLKIGRALGFPTANIALDLKLDQPYGVYMVKIHLGEVDKTGLLYYGPRKTKGLPEAVVCEVTIFDFDEELYGQQLTFSIGTFIRDPKEFDSPTELREQIEKDVQTARRYENGN